MKLVIFGASGGIGKALVSQAVAKGHDVKAVYRTTPATSLNNCESLIIPDITDPAAVAKAIEKTQVVFSSIGLRRLHPTNPWSKITSPLDLTSKFAETLREVMQSKSGPKTVIAVSAGGVGGSWTQVSLPLQKLFRFSNIGRAYSDLNRMESIYEKSNLDWYCVRPTTLNNRLNDTLPRLVEHYGLFSQISRHQVAFYMLGLAESSGRPKIRTPMISA